MEELRCVCRTCEKDFIFKYGRKKYKGIYKHYCSINCQNIKHGLARRGKTLTRDNGERYEDYRYMMWCGAKKRCKLNKKEFDLIPGDIPEIPQFCPVLGIEIKKNNISGPIDSSPSLDRIDQNKGYIKGNIRIISNRANRIKSDASFEEIEKIYEDLKKIKEQNESI